MNFSEFEQSTERTWSTRPGRDSLLNAGLGCGGEGGEVADLVKKEIFHRKDVPVEDYLHEVGDVLYYLARIAREKGFTLEEAAVANVAKLRIRYPNGKFPHAREMEVWCEGHQAQGSKAPARRLIHGEFDSFDEAVQSWLGAQDSETHAYVVKKAPGQWTYWGCHLFDNEADARKAFG